MEYYFNFKINFEKKNSSLKEIQNADTSTEEDVNIDESVSPDEPLYCICKNVAYGTMVACDNKEVIM